MPDLAAVTRAPRWVVLQLTERCNLRCAMCYEWGQCGSYHHRGVAELDYGVVERVIGEVAPYRPYFGLFGGEPLLYPRVGEVLALLQRAGCNVDIPTNGTLLDEQAEMLVETAPRRLWVSLDGPEEINDRQRGRGVYRRVLAGIEKLLQARQGRGREFPKVGITLIVTPLNSQHIAAFFAGLLASCALDHVSIEFQNYATPAQYREYTALLQREFGVDAAPVAAGVVQDPTHFTAMDCEELAHQIGEVRRLCAERGVYFIAYPKTISATNYRAYWAASWQEMADWTGRCAFPWIYAEVSARGQVTSGTQMACCLATSSCHTFYDLSMGNVYQRGLLEIWRGAAYERYRAYLRQELFPICTACSRYYSDPSKK